MLKILLSLALINPLKKTVFYGGLLMTQNRIFDVYVFVSEQKFKRRV